MSKLWDDITAIRVGGQTVESVMKGDSLVWQGSVFAQYMLEDNLPPVIIKPENGHYALNGFATTIEAAMGFGRNSEGAFTDSNGQLAIAASGEARVNHDKDGNFDQVFMHPAETNLLPESADFSAASWAKNKLYTPTANSAISYTGSSYEIKANGTNGIISDNGIALSSDDYSMWWVAKAGSADFAYVFCSGFTASETCYVDLTDGSVSNIVGGNMTWTTEDLGNGEWLIKGHGGLAGADKIGNFGIGPRNTAGANSADGDSIHVALCMAANADKIYSYVPSTGGATTRAAETSSLSTGDFDYSDTEGTILMDWASPAEDYQRLFTFYKDATHEIFGQRSGPSNNIIRGFIDDTTTVGQIDISTPGAGVAVDAKQTTSWIAGSLKGSSDGVAATEDTVGVTVPSGATKLSIAEDGNGNLQLGGFREFFYHNKSLLQATQDTWTGT